MHEQSAPSGPTGPIRTVGLAAGAAVVAAVALWLASLGVPALTWILAVAGGALLAVAAVRWWAVGRAWAAVVGLVYALTVIFPGAALADDLALSARGQAQPATVVDFRHVSGVHVSSSYTVLRLGQGVVLPGTVPAEVQIDRTSGLAPGQKVTVLVDPDGHVDPLLPEDVHTGLNAVLLALGLGLVVLAVVWWGIAATREARLDREPR